MGTPTPRGVLFQSSVVVRHVVTAAPADSSSAKQSVKEQVALTQAGSIVEVKLKNKTKVKGKLGTGQ